MIDDSPTKQKHDSYKHLVDTIESARMYDGRNKGVDVYICDKCNEQFFTKYKDKGVTPFTIRCKNDNCNGTMIHKHTIPEEDAKIECNVLNVKIHNWIRPTIEQFDNILKQKNEGLIYHLLNGGLVLEDSLSD